MSPEPDEKIKSDAPEDGTHRKVDVSEELNQLQGKKTPKDSDAPSPDIGDRNDEISPAKPDGVVPPADQSPRDEVPPDSNEIQSSLKEENADQKIREELLTAQKWQEKQDIIAHEREIQRKRIEQEIEADSQKKSVGKWKRNTIIGVTLLILIIAAAWLTFSVEPNLPAQQDSFPYVSSYNVRIAQGEPVNFAGIPVTVSGSGDKVIVSIRGGLGTEIGIGDKITLSSPKRMVIQIFGVTLFESDYQIVAKFRGYVPKTSQNDFTVDVMTTRPVPEWAVGVIMPDGIDIIPVSKEDF